MATPLFTNFARTTLAAGITNVATTLNVSPGTGALFPSPGASQYFPLVMVNSSGAREIAYCTARSTDALTITRAQEGTTGLAFNAGDVCGLRVTGASLADLLTLVGSPAAAESTVASATTTNIGAANTMSVAISGTATITAFDTVASGTKRLCRATGAFTLTNSGNLVCPGGANITAAAGDLFWAETTGGGVWYIGPYQRASGQALVTTVVTDAGVAGTTRNAKMNITAASSSGTFTADEVVVETALGGSSLKLSSYNQTVNLATTGAGGMDTGTAPVSGFVSVYAIAKPDGTKSILACAVATSSGTIYSGANMPAGYTYSGLIGVWPTDSSSRFVAGIQLDRKVSLQKFISIFTNQTGPTTLTLQSIAAGVPAVARAADICMYSGSGSNSFAWATASDASGTGYVAGTQFSTTFGSAYTGFGGVGSITGQVVLPNTPIITSQTIYWVELFGRVSASSMAVAGYSF